MGAPPATSGGGLPTRSGCVSRQPETTALYRVMQEHLLTFERSSAVVATAGVAVGFTFGRVAGR